MLHACDLLDPRPALVASRAPIRNAATIPFLEVAQRVAELPAPGAAIRVAQVGDDAEAMRDWLSAHGRDAALTSEFEFDDRPASARLPDRFRLWRPTEFIESSIGRVAAHGRGSAGLRGAGIDIACGVGRDAVFAADAGYEMLGVDILPDAIARARDVAARYLAPPGGARFETRDVTQADVADRWRERFDLILVSRFLDRDLLPKLPQMLRPGGALLYETFTTRHRERNERPRSAARLLRPDELRSAFSGLRIRHYDEDWRENAHTARLWAERPE